MPLQDTTIPISEKVLTVARDVIHALGVSPDHTDIWDRLLIFLAVVIVATLAYFLFNKLIIRLVHYIVTHTKTHWDIMLYENHFFRRVFEMIPPLLVLWLLPLAFEPDYVKLMRFIEKVINIYILIIIARIIIVTLHTFYDYYLLNKHIKNSPYKGVFEMARLFVIGLTILACIGVLLNIKISHVITGLSAFAAVLVLVFRDTLLGFVAGIQLAQNKMIHIGDWITVPDTNANGVVVDITILTVRVQNFDNTYVFVPAYTLISNPFQNWIGMYASGVRRMKMTALLDVLSLKDPDEALLKNIYQEPLIQNYFKKKQITSFEEDKSQDDQYIHSNLGLFRIWIRLMLEADPQISAQPYIIIQDLQSQGSGLPLQFLFFAKTTDWNLYEEIQSRIYEQVMTTLPRFGLRPFQFNEVLHSPETPVSSLQNTTSTPPKK